MTFSQKIALKAPQPFLNNKKIHSPVIIQTKKRKISIKSPHQTYCFHVSYLSCKNKTKTAFAHFHLTKTQLTNKF